MSTDTLSWPVLLEQLLQGESLTTDQATRLMQALVG